MRAILMLLAALVLLSVGAFGQSGEYIYRVPLTAVNTYDTIPGTHVGGGAGKAGWLYIGDAKEVIASWANFDSAHYTVKVNFADSGFASATGSSAKITGFKTLPTADKFGAWPGTAVLAPGIATWTVVDSVAAITNTANPHAFGGVALRKGDIDLIPGARWLQFIFFVPNVASKIAGADGNQQIKLRVTYK